MKLNFQYVHSESMGYGRLGTALARELPKHGVEIFDYLPEPDRLKGPALDHLGMVNVGEREGIAPAIIWVSVPTHAHGWYKGQVPFIFTMWEARRLPPSFRETLHEFQTVIVPSWQNVELFSDFHSDVRFVPLGIDPDVWHYVPRKPPGTYFNFLIAGSGPRKGTDLAHKAFRKVFGDRSSWGDGPIPQLIMKNPRGEAFHGERVQVVAGRLSGEAEVALYEDAHCYLQPSRGEGFGLQPLQAMAQGCPTILTAAHGHESFASFGYGIDSSPAQSAYFIYGDAGDWWEPDFDELCERMHYVYHNYEEAVAHAAISSEAIAEDWTWTQTADKLIDALGRDLLASECDNFEWYKPTLQQFRVVTNRDWSCEVAGAHYQFLKDQPQWCVADVKRILFEANLLAPECLEDPDHGLLPEQLARLPEYLERHNHCQLCGQELNSRPTRADKYADASQ